MTAEFQQINVDEIMELEKSPLGKHHRQDCCNNCSRQETSTENKNDANNMKANYLRGLNWPSYKMTFISLGQK